MYIEGNPIEEKKERAVKDEGSFGHLLSVLVNSKKPNPENPDLLLDLHQKVIYDTLYSMYTPADEDVQEELLEKIKKTPYAELKKIYFDDREDTIKERVLRKKPELVGEEEHSAKAA